MDRRARCRFPDPRAASTCVAAALGCTTLLAFAQQPPIRIAHIDTFSGPTASTGTTVAKTLLYATSPINERGGEVLGRKLEVIQMDNAGDSNKAVAMLTSTVDQKIPFRRCRPATRALPGHCLPPWTSITSATPIRACCI